MDFELFDTEEAFQAEVERFLGFNHSPDVMDPDLIEHDGQLFIGSCLIASVILSRKIALPS